MRALVVFCHPDDSSFTAAVLGVVQDRLARARADVRLADLYAEAFDPVLPLAGLQSYTDASENCALVMGYVDDVRWCDTLIFVYPTWWYGQPAILKGWLDRVLLPEVAFLMPDEIHRSIRPGLGHIRRLGVFTTCGASRWLTLIVGAPGRRTLMRGVGFLCAKPLRTAFAAHYLMDSSTDASRRRHLEKVGNRMDRLLKHDA